ncbi:MAG TPA: hypothetical protein VGJ07_32195 [Rugosimonospora sp.]
MPARDYPTAEDFASVRLASARLQERGWPKRFTIQLMLSEWSQFVSEVEDGYDGSLEEYGNDLSYRDYLAEVWPLVTPHIRDVWRDELAGVDERFRAATVEDSDSAAGADVRAGGGADGWWHRRLPRLLVSALADDLRMPGRESAG